MKTMIRAAMMAVSIASIGPAFAESEGGPAANTQFTQTRGYLAEAPVQQAPSIARAQNGQVVHAYVANSSRGTWLFPPNQNEGANN
jgi:hypothetical protein